MTRRSSPWLILRNAIVPCLLLLIAQPVWASAFTVTDLVEERAMAELGDVMPANGRLDVRLAEGVVREGAFIQEFWIDPDSGQFIANVVSELGQTNRVWGLAVMTVDVPVPTRRLLPDEIVQASDLRIVEMPIQRLGTFAIDSSDDLVGKQVRRMLAAGRPVPRQSVIPPVIINRGEKVKILLNYGGLQLTAVGRAMADAHKGEEIRVVNLSSNKAISATASGPGLVEVDQ